MTRASHPTNLRHPRGFLSLSFQLNSKPPFHSPLLNCPLKQKATLSSSNPTNISNKDFAFALSLRAQQYESDPAL
jgi:hypothetical protein